MKQVSAPQHAMQHPIEPGPELEAEARAWVRLLASGQARQEDARHLQRWCDTSAAHAAAFRAASGMWRQLGPVAEQAGASDPELAAIRRAVARGRLAPAAPSRLTRRTFIGGAVAASAAVAGVMLVHPPLELWPSLAQLQGDYRTTVGQQLQVALAPDVDLQLNTRSSVAIREREGATVNVDLIDGEVAVRTSRPFTISAGRGHIDTTASRFEVRRLDGEVCVTCLEGRVEVRLDGSGRTLSANQQLVYGGGASTMPVVSTVDVQAAASWQQGLISFRQTALDKVVSEINRYRPGRLVLMADAVREKPVSGRFRIDELDKAVAQIQRLFHLKATSLPGGVVILA